MNSREKPHFPSRESPPSALHPLSPSSSSPPLINFDETIGSVSSEQLGFEAFSALKSSQRGSFGEELVFTDIKEFPSSSPLMEFEASFSSLKSSIGSSSAEKSVGIYAMKELVSLSSPLETFSAQTFPKSHSVGEKLGLSGVIPSSSSSSLASIDFETFSTPKSSKGSFSREKLCFKERSSMSASLNMDFGGFSTVKLEHESVSCLEKMGSAIEEPPCLLTSSKWGSSEEKAIPVSSQVMLHEACSYKDAEGESMPAPQPLECLHGIPVPPFLSKTYDLVNDPSFDSVISWGSSGESFVVWDTVEFSRTILPRHFKHNNFSSFVRQLNTYGFRKIDTDQWEFANEEFLKDKRHLLKNIHRRKSHQGSQIGQSVGLPLALAKSGLEGEAQKLREEKNSLMQEVVKLQQEHLVTVNQMDKMNQRLQAVEQRQKQMVSFLAKLLQNPAFLSHLQCQKEHREVAATRAKRKFLKQQQAGPSNLDSSMEGQIVRYKPTWGIAATSTMELQDIRPDAGKRLPDYLLRDMVRKLGLDAVAGAQAQSGDVAMDESKKIFAETSKQIGVEGPRSPTSDPRDIVSKGKDALSSQVDVSSGGSEYFVAFPEDLSQEKMPSFLMLPTTESIIKEEDIWSMGFDAGASQPSSSHDVWGNILSSDVEELAVSAGLSNFWDLESHQPEAASGMDKWTADESSFDDLETQLGLLEEDLS